MEVKGKEHGVSAERQWASVSNTILNSCWELSMVERSIIMLALGNMRSSLPANSNTLYELDIKDYATLRKISTQDAYETLKENSNKLFERHISIKNHPGIKGTYKFRWINGINFIAEEHKIRIQWSQHILEFISELRAGNFTQLPLSEYIPMEGKYTTRLWDMLVQERWKGCIGVKRVDIDELIENWCIPESCRALKVLKSKILKPAIKELELKGLALILLKDGRKDRKFVKELIFEYKLEKADKLDLKEEKVVQKQQINQRLEEKFERKSV